MTSGNFSPQQTPLESPSIIYDRAPPLLHTRSAPDAHELKVAAKRGSSEEEDANYEPGTKGRGRKRQRIPHTAVERRYRENLNAHLEKLRQTVPTLASRKGPGSGKATSPGEGVKPSKCEILHGAIEFINASAKEAAGKDKRIADLMIENANLRANLDHLQNFIRATSR
jgi:hypothetical protein